MTYFDPKIYCKQNLLDEDRRELEFWHDEILGMIEGAKPDEFEGSISETFDKIRDEVIDNYAEWLKNVMNMALQDMLISIIDSYEHEVCSVDDPETFL